MSEPLMRTTADAEMQLRYRRQAQMIAQIIDWSRAEEKFERACGDCLCAHCGLQYYDHPCNPDLHLYVTCDGKFWHL